SFPILDKALKKRVIDEAFTYALRDNQLAWRALPDGCYVKVKNSSKPFSLQDHLTRQGCLEKSRPLSRTCHIGVLPCWLCRFDPDLTRTDRGLLYVKARFITGFGRGRHGRGRTDDTCRRHHGRWRLVSVSHLCQVGRPIQQGNR